MSPLTSFSIHFFEVDQLSTVSVSDSAEQTQGRRQKEGKAGPYLSSGATGTQAAGRGDHREPGKDHLLEVAAEGTGPGGACEERPVRRGMGQRSQSLQEGNWPLTSGFPLQWAPQGHPGRELHALWAFSSSLG